MDAYNKRQSNPSIPNDAIVIGQTDNVIGISSGENFNESLNINKIEFRESLSLLIVDHIENLKKLIDDPRLDNPLDSAINMKNEIKSVILDKMYMAIEDGKVHSAAISDVKGTILINISCVVSNFSELKEKYEKEVGPYKYLVDKYLSLAQKNKIDNFLHIIYCNTPDWRGGITATYIDIDMVNQIYIKPDELFL